MNVIEKFDERHYCHVDQKFDERDRHDSNVMHVTW